MIVSLIQVLIQVIAISTIVNGNSPAQSNRYLKNSKTHTPSSLISRTGTYDNAPGQQYGSRVWSKSQNFPTVHYISPGYRSGLNQYGNPTEYGVSYNQYPGQAVYTPVYTQIVPVAPQYRAQAHYRLPSTQYGQSTKYRSQGGHVKQVSASYDDRPKLINYEFQYDGQEQEDTDADYGPDEVKQADSVNGKYYGGRPDNKKHTTANERGLRPRVSYDKRLKPLLNSLYTSRYAARANKSRVHGGYALNEDSADDDSE